MNFVAEWIPDGPYQRSFDAAMQISHALGSEAKVVLFGDSRATRFHTEFFSDKTLSFALQNNTVIFSKLLFDSMIAETNVRPKVIILCLGANNFNKNGLFPLRDFAIRRLATFSEIRAFLAYRGGYSNAMDALSCRLFRIYGRRLEIRSVANIRNLLEQRNVPVGPADIKGMKPLERRLLVERPVRSAINDRNYLMIYERSVFNSYETSALHVGMLEELIDKGIENGATVVIVQLPIESTMRELARKLVGTTFDDYLTDLGQRKAIIHLDLRVERRFEFDDLNHLSWRGAQDLTREVLNPMIAQILKQQQGAISDGDQVRFESSLKE